QRARGRPRTPITCKLVAFGRRPGRRDLMRVVDTFTFFNELDILELRLRELSDVVDQFVLVEATTTHSGQDKPLFFEDNKERFSAWESQIVHHVVDDLPRTSNRWLPENVQRKRIGDALASLRHPLGDDDLVLISDVDEIPRRSTIGRLTSLEPSEVLILEMRH